VLDQAPVAGSVANAAPSRQGNRSKIAHSVGVRKGPQESLYDPAALRRMMAERGLTGREVAVATGLSENTIVAALAGGNVRARTMVKIISCLQAQPAVLADVVRR
jgi:DNA-binding Xre family transcriptional regulator